MTPGHHRRATLLTLAGHAIPALVGLAVVPALLEALGNVGFGAFAVAWALLGYLSLFDLGIARATTRLIAAHDTPAGQPLLRSLLSRALRVQLVAGSVAGALIFVAAPWLAPLIANGVDGFTPLLTQALRVIAAGLPVVLIGTALLGTLEGLRRFASVTALRAPTNAGILLLPWAAVSAGGGLTAAVGALVAARILGAIAAGIVVHRALPPGDSDPVLPPLSDTLRFGGWLTVSNVIGPLLGQTDRLILGARAGLAAVTPYAIPFDLVTRLWIIPSSAVTAVFPTFSADPHSPGARHLLIRATTVVSAGMAAITIPAAILAAPLLDAWIGGFVAAETVAPARWLLLAVTVNTVAWVPLAWLQGAGKAEIPALSHLAQLLPYLAFLWWATGRFGATGAAAAFALRAVVDTTVLLIATARLSRAPATATQ